MEDKKNIVNIYIEQMIDNFYNNKYKREQYIDILFFGVEMLKNNIVRDFLKKEITEIIKRILMDIKVNTIEYPFVFQDGIANGKVELAFAIRSLHEYQGGLDKLLNSVEEELVNSLYNKLDYMYTNMMRFSFYDVISGLSSGMYYLLNSSNLLLRKDIYFKIEKLLHFLIDCTKDYRYENCILIKFHVQCDYQVTNIEKEIMKNGHINLGMAHGILGPLITLVKAYELEIRLEGQKEAILKLYNIYKRFETKKKGILVYSRRVSIENYIKGKISDITENFGWCYGNISVVRGLMKTTRILGLDYEYRMYQEEMVILVNQPYINYNFTSPIVCHGYASIVTMQLIMYLETGDIRYISTLERNVTLMIKEHKRLLESNFEYSNNLSLLSGSGGVIMTILASISFDFNYHKILLID